MQIKLSEHYSPAGHASPNISNDIRAALDYVYTTRGILSMSSSGQSNVPAGDPAGPKRSTHVPGQYGGYSLQATRLLAKLLEAPAGSKVSLEVFEDVGVESADGQRTAEQVKSTFDSNPVSDRSVDLWKTFSNWVDAVRDDELQIGNTIFEIHVSRPVTGAIVRSFSEAASPRDAQAALRQARDKLWGTPPQYPNRAKVSDGIKPFLENVFDADESVTCGIVEAFSLSCGSGDAHADLESKVEEKFVAREFIPDVVLHTLGWVKSKTDRLVERQMPAVISRDEFYHEVTTYLRKIAYRGILESFARDPNQQEIETHLRLKDYVRQLELIGCDDDEKLEAVRDFLLASVNRTHWSEQGLIHDSSFDDFEENLVRTWKNNKRAAHVEASSHDDVNKGRLLYSKCSAHHAKLEGFEVPPHFTPGSFHALSDEGTVGWHPDYKNKLKALQKKGGGE
jgi:hypothetical protein